MLISCSLNNNFQEKILVKKKFWGLFANDDFGRQNVAQNHHLQISPRKNFN